MQFDDGHLAVGHGKVLGVLSYVRAKLHVSMFELRAQVCCEFFEALSTGTGLGDPRHQGAANALNLFRGVWYPHMRCKSARGRADSLVLHTVRTTTTTSNKNHNRNHNHNHNNEGWPLCRSSVGLVTIAPSLLGWGVRQCGLGGDCPALAALLRAVW